MDLLTSLLKHCNKKGKKNPGTNSRHIFHLHADSELLICKSVKNVTRFLSSISQTYSGTASRKNLGFRFCHRMHQWRGYPFCQNIYIEKVANRCIWYKTYSHAGCCIMRKTHTNTGVRTMHFGVYFKQVPSCDLYILFLQGSKHIRSYQLDRSDLGESRCQ